MKGEVRMLGETIFEDDCYKITSYVKSNDFPTFICFSSRENEYEEKRDFGREFAKEALLNTEFNYISFSSIQNCWYQHVSRDCLQALCSFLKQLQNKVITYGSSMGGFAAIAIGQRISCDYFFALSPQFSIASPYMSSIKDGRFPEAQKRLTPTSINILDSKASSLNGLVVFDPLQVDGFHARSIVEQTGAFELPLVGSGHGGAAAVNKIYGLKNLLSKIAQDTARLPLSDIRKQWEQSITAQALLNKACFVDSLIKCEYKIDNLTIRNLLKWESGEICKFGICKLIPKILKVNDKLAPSLLQKIGFLAKDCDCNAKEIAKSTCKRGVSLMQNGEFELATQFFQAALAIQPNLHNAKVKNIQCLSQSNNFEQALAHCDELIALNGHEGQPYELKGNVLLRQKRYQEAMQYYKRGIEVAPRFSQLQFRLSKVLLTQGQNQVALEYALEAVSIEPKNEQYIANLSECYIRNGYGEKALLLSDNYSGHLFSGGSLQEKLTKFRSAIFAGRIAVIPIGFRCYTKGIFSRLFNFTQPSLPFDSGFFPPASILSVFQEGFINLDNNNHKVCIKSENFRNEKGKLGINFKTSTYTEIDKLVETHKSISKFLDSTYGYYTTSTSNHFTLAHYNWHKNASLEKSGGIYDYQTNLVAINEMMNKRLSRLESLCENADEILLVSSNTQSYSFMSIDKQEYELDNFCTLTSYLQKKYNKRVTHIQVSREMAAADFIEKYDYKM